ncbi:MAG: hypothetical protein ACLT98_09390 [Eggerthellaceae bacterium]
MGQPINLSNRIGFIFDCDGTLLDTMDAWLCMEDVFAARVGAHITPDQRKGLCTMTMPEEAMWLHTMLGVGSSVKELEQRSTTTSWTTIRPGKPPWARWKLSNRSPAEESPAPSHHQARTPTSGGKPQGCSVLHNGSLHRRRARI